MSTFTTLPYYDIAHTGVSSFLWNVLCLSFIPGLPSLRDNDTIWHSHKVALFPASLSQVEGLLGWEAKSQLQAPF